MTKAFAGVEYCDGLYADTSFVIEELYHKAQALVLLFCDKYGLEVLAPQVLAALDAVKAVVYGAVKVVKYIRDACTTLLRFLGIL